jgi:phosphoenolpyruvate carboxykinase (ATP)
LVIIVGSSYAGEIKKSVFSLLNYLLPARDVLPMHCSANIGPDGESAIFFGLSGTGKTTLSADSSRILIGDDEHGWTPDGLFNFEGGCYAKVINLSAEAEPEIYAATHRFGTVLENVVMDPATRALDLADGSLTENTRSSYPLSFIPNASESGQGPVPTNVVMLTADAFGVLPPISKMTVDQAMYHFLSGYTAKVAGTEKGMGNEPEATFSTCFGAPFMPRHPSVYAKLLGARIRQGSVNCWLVNTGWSGGAYGVGERMKIAHTRAMVSAALDGRLSGVGTTTHPTFGLRMPDACPDVPGEVLNPKNTWADKKAYDHTARDLASRFEANFKQFESHVDDDINAAGIRAA